MEFFPNFSFGRSLEYSDTADLVARELTEPVGPNGSSVASLGFSTYEIVSSAGKGEVSGSDAFGLIFLRKRGGRNVQRRVG